MLSFIEISAPGYFLEFLNCIVVAGCYRTNGSRDCLFLVLTRSVYSKCDLKRRKGKNKVDNKNLQKKSYGAPKVQSCRGQNGGLPDRLKGNEMSAVYKARNMCPRFLLANLLSTNILHCHTSAWCTGIACFCNVIESPLLYDLIDSTCKIGREHLEWL